MPTTGGGRKPEPELDRLSNILKAFNDQFGNIPWTDADRVQQLITEEIPAKVAADTAYQNAKQNSRQAERPHRARQGAGARDDGACSRTTPSCSSSSGTTSLPALADGYGVRGSIYDRPTA